VALTIAGTGPTTISGIISNNTAPGQTSLTKNVTGTLTLSGANTFTGGVTLNAGSLNINNAAALGGAVASGMPLATRPADASVELSERAASFVDAMFMRTTGATQVMLQGSSLLGRVRVLM
jgi:autotransporter-associated beta strand protein